MVKTFFTLSLIAATGLAGGCSRGTIWQAAQRGDLDSTKLIVQWHPDRINKIDPDSGRTPLQSAIVGSYGNTVQLLLDKGADPTIESADGRTTDQFAQAVANERMRGFILDAIDGAVAWKQIETDERAAAVVGADPQ